jgi:hypothetical protein
MTLVQRNTDDLDLEEGATEEDGPLALDQWVAAGEQVSNIGVSGMPPFRQQGPYRRLRPEEILYRGFGVAMSVEANAAPWELGEAGCPQ